MQQAVMHHFPDAQATYRFTHRDTDVLFTRESIEEFKAAVSRTCLIIEHCIYNRPTRIL
jgi:nicotinate phosphoribosyltransferase